MALIRAKVDGLTRRRIRGCTSTMFPSIGNCSMDRSVYEAKGSISESPALAKIDVTIVLARFYTSPRWLRILGPMKGDLRHQSFRVLAIVFMSQSSDFLNFGRLDGIRQWLSSPDFSNVLPYYSNWASYSLKKRPSLIACLRASTISEP
jgi:hypothetical protein